MSLIPEYEVGKAAQAVAFFALKEGGKINVLKLTKLLYLAEREFMARYDTPMFYDYLVSMPSGPVVTITLNLLNNEDENDVWAKYVGPRNGLDIPVQDKITFDDLDDLSIADREILELLWKRFGKWDRFRLRNYTHQKENIPEWEDPRGSSTSISHEDVFKYLNKKNSKALAKNLEEYRKTARYLAETK